jgi:hypothetical protein
LRNPELSETRRRTVRTVRTRLLQHFRGQFVGYIALVLAIGGGTAYAANTIGSSDIIDESILTQDIKNAEVKASEIAAGAVNTDKIANGQVLSGDVRDDTLANGGLAASDLGPGSVGPSEVIDNSLTGADINESTLNGAAGVRIDSEIPATDGHLVKVLQIKGLTLSTRCFGNVGGFGDVELVLVATGPDGSVVNYSGIGDQTSSTELKPYLSGTTLSATPKDIFVLWSFVAPQPDKNFGLNYIHGVYRSPSNTVSFEINAVATEGGGGICQFHGTATPTP